MSFGTLGSMVSRAALLCALGLVVAAPALAEPGDSKKSNEAETEAEAAEGESGDGASEEATESPDAKLDEPPPKGARGGGTKLSPLNPRPEEFPQEGPSEAPVSLAELLSDIAALRSRVAALTTALYASQLRVFVAAEGDDSRIEQLVVTLDDGVVFTAKDTFVAEETRQIYEHAVAPGQHVLGIEVERHDARAESFRTWQSSRFSIQVPENERLEVDLVLEDDSDMGEEFPDDRDGEYDLRVRARALIVE